MISGQWDARPQDQVRQGRKGHIRTKTRITRTNEGQIENTNGVHMTNQWMNLLDEITIIADIETADKILQ